MRLIDVEMIKIPISMIHSISGCCIIRMKDMQRIITRQPTAFDKEKVIEELQFLKQDAIRHKKTDYADAYELAIEVVKKGGIE